MVLRIAVVGLGIYGSAVVSNLARQRDAAGLDIEIVGFEAFASPHDQGSSHGRSRMCRLVNFESPHLTESALRSVQLLRQLEEDPAVQQHLRVTYPPAPGVTLTNAPPLYLNNGVLFFGPKEDMMQDTHGVANAVQLTMQYASEHNRKAAASGAPMIKYDYLTALQIQERFPYFTIRKDSEDPEDPDALHGYFEHDAGTMFPERCVTALQFDATRRDKVHLVHGVRIDGRQQLPDGRVRLTSPSPCEHLEQPFDLVVLSAGIWVQDLLPPSLKSQFTLERHLFAWLETAPEAQALFSMEGGAPNCVRFAFRKERPPRTAETTVPPEFESVLTHATRPPVETRKGLQYIDFFYMFPSCTSFGEPLKVAQENSVRFSDPHTHGYVPCGLPVGTGSMMEGERPTSYRQVHDAEVRRTLQEVQPYLGGLTGRVLSKGACAYTVQPGHKFIVDWLPADELSPDVTSRRCLVVSCCSGHGFKHAPAIAEAVAGLVLSRLCGAPRTYPTGIFAFDADTPRSVDGDEYAWKGSP